MKFQILAALLACGASTWLSAGGRLANVPLGTIVMDGSSDSSGRVATGAIDPGGKLIGQITNKTGMTLDDVSFCVWMSGGGTPNPPVPPTPPVSGGNIKVTGGGASKEGSTTSDPEGFCGKVDFGGGDAPPKMTDGATYDFEIPIDTPGTSTTITVWITPSTKDKESLGDAHADVMSAFELSSDTIGMTNRMIAPFHDRCAMLIQNAGRRESEWIKQLSGSVTLPDGVTLTSVSLLDPSGAFAPVSGADVQLDGDSFHITGFAPMEPGRTYELVTRYSAVPGGEVLIQVLAGF